MKPDQYRVRARVRKGDPARNRDRFAEKNKRLAMAALFLVLLIFLAGVTSVLALHLWPDLFERILFES